MINPQNENYPNIHIIGIGATGSYVALALASLGFNDKLHFYDMDIVEMKNIGNQSFSMEHIGLPKVEAMKKVYQKKTGQPFVGGVNCIEVDQVLAENLDGIVLLLVDSVQARREIFTGLANSKTELVIETGIDIFSTEIRTIQMNNKDDVEKTMNLFNNRSESPPTSRWGLSACGSPNNAVMTSMITGAMATSFIVSYLLGLEINKEVLLGYEGKAMLVSSSKTNKRSDLCQN